MRNMLFPTPQILRRIVSGVVSSLLMYIGLFTFCQVIGGWIQLVLPLFWFIEFRVTVRVLKLSHESRALY